MVRNYTTIQLENVESMALELSKQEIPEIDVFEPIADFEELLEFSEAHPIPIMFSPDDPAWRLESVATRVVEMLAITSNESLVNEEWKSLARLLLDHTEYLLTYPDAPTDRERLIAGSVLALVGNVCNMLPQSELWRLVGFGRIASTITTVLPSSESSHIIQPIDTAFSLAQHLNLPILDSAVENYNTVLNRNVRHQNLTKYPLNDKDVFTYLNLDYPGLECVKSTFKDGNITEAKSAYTTFRKDTIKKIGNIPGVGQSKTFYTVKSYLNSLLQLVIYPTPPIYATTELAIAALLFPELRFSKQILIYASRRYKWIVNQFFYQDGYHKDKTRHAQIEAMTDFSRFLSIYNSISNPPEIECSKTIEELLEKQLEACYFLSQPDLMFPQTGDEVGFKNSNVVDLCKNEFISPHKHEEFLYISSSGEQGTKPNTLSYVMPYTGYYVMRDTWDSDAQYLLFDCGPLGKHGSKDQLNFTLYAHGRQLITSSSIISVSKSESSSIGKQSVIQNKKNVKVSIPQSESDNISNFDTRWISNSPFDFVEGWHKSAEFQHKRSIFYIRGEYFILHDLVLGNNDSLLEQYFHLAACSAEYPSTHIESESCHAWTEEVDNSNIFLGVVDPTNMNGELSGDVLTFHTHQQLPTTMNVILLPMKQNNQKLPTISSIDVDVPPDVLATSFTVESDGVTDIFLISDDGYTEMYATAKGEKIEFEGEYLFLRGNDFVMLNARYLKVGTEVIVDLDEPTEYYINFS